MPTPRALLLVAPLLAAPLLLSSGCALAQESIRIEPVAAKGVTPLPGASAVSLRLHLADLRNDPSPVVARKINGFGMQMANISSDEPIVDVLGRSMTAELQARGYRVAADGAVPLILELVVFSHEFRVGFVTAKSEALVTFLATIRDAGGRELYRELISAPFEHAIFFAGGEEVKTSYEGALSAAAEKLVSSPGFQRALQMSVAPPVL